MTVRLTSEDAGAIALSPVVVQEMTLGELVEQVLFAAGKDQARIREIARRGTFAYQGTRFRWQGVEISESTLNRILQTFPDAQPNCTFSSDECTAVLLRDGLRGVEVTKLTGSGTRTFKRQTFWGSLVPLMRALSANYLHYDYQRQADVVEAALSVTQAGELRESAQLLRDSALRRALSGFEPRQLRLITPRAAFETHPPRPPE